MTSPRDALRNTAAGLRIKASTGTLAVAAARDIATILPRVLAAQLDASIEAGELAKRWTAALTAARAALPMDADEPVVQLAALSDVLAWHGAQASRVAVDYATRIEGDRRAAEGRASGIEEALAAEDAMNAPTT